MTIRIERRQGKIGVDISVRMPDGSYKRERRAAPVQNEIAAWKWARRREVVMAGGDDPGQRTTISLNCPGTIYFVQVASGAIKVGWSSALKARFSGLQAAIHEEAKLLATMPGTLGDEKRLHRQFADLRIRREWFRPEEPLLTHIAKLQLDSTWTAPSGTKR